MTMQKKLVYILAFLIVAFSLQAKQASAYHNPHAKDVIPEKSGLYDDPEHPGVKVRVIVHPERPAREEQPVLACELGDPDSTEQVSAAGWHLPANWTYNLNSSSVPSSVGGANLATIVSRSFDSWEAASGNNITFSAGPNTTIARSVYDGKNIIAWGRTNGSALGVTYIRYYTSTGLVVDVDTIMNKKFPWRWSNSASCAYTEAYDAENIMNHELGHWIGLDDEYDTGPHQHATMFGYGAKGEVKKITLEDGDITGTYLIYNQ